MTKIKPHCQRLKFEDVKKFIEEKGYTLLDDFYINVQTKMNVMCDKNHVFQMSLENLRKCKCPKCQRVAKPTIEEINAHVGVYGYSLIDKEYKNNNHKMTFKCPNNHLYLSRWSQFQRGQRCPYCAGNKRYTIEYVKQYTFDYGYELISTTYNGAHSKIDLICPNGHDYQCSFHNFIRGKRCGSCISKSRGEQQIQLILSELGVKFKTQHTFDDCRLVFKLPFDFYLYELNIVIEYDGEQHFYPIDFGGKGIDWALEQFIKTQKRDKAKDDYCKQNRIKLVRIPYYESNNIKNIIMQILKQENPQRLSLK